MAKKLTGIVTQFGTKGYGFIEGDNGEKYFVHQKSVYGKTKLIVNTRVRFKAENSDKGWVAIEVKPVDGIDKVSSRSLSDTTIKAMFIFLLVMQIIIAYYVFFVY